jgi:hypothetical protein
MAREIMPQPHTDLSQNQQEILKDTDSGHPSGEDGSAD